MTRSLAVSSFPAPSRVLFRSIIDPRNIRLEYLLRRWQSTTSPYPSSQPFSYSISAAYSAKGAPLDPLNNLHHIPSSFHTKSPTNASNGHPRRGELIPRKSSRPKSGQDAYFMSTVADTGSIAFGVADGVGGWQDSGVDPADFSHSLCGHMANIAASKMDQSLDNRYLQLPGTGSGIADEGLKTSGKLKPLELLDQSFEKVLQDGSVWAGGSTACVASASRDGVLEVANLGDSGYAHIAPFRLSHMSSVQQHEFNTPFQLSKIPARLRRQMQLFGSLHYDDMPADADLYSHQLSHGDVFVFATDGVWDNLSPEDVLDVVCGVMVRFRGWVLGNAGGVKIGERLAVVAENCFENGSSDGLVAAGADTSSLALSSAVASAIVKEAKEASVNLNRDSPFGKAVKQAYPFESWRGGKVDDICVIAGLVLQYGL